MLYLSNNRKDDNNKTNILTFCTKFLVLAPPNDFFSGPHIAPH